jgi:hypothetical protein
VDATVATLSHPKKLLESETVYSACASSRPSGCHLHGLRRPPDLTTANSAAREILAPFIAGFCPQSNAIATKSFNPPPQTPSSAAGSITAPPCNPRFVNELPRHFRGRPSLEEKAAKPLSLGRFPSQRHFETGRLRHQNCPAQAPFAKVLALSNSAK